MEAAPGEAMGSFYAHNVRQSTQPIPAGSIRSLRVVRVFPQNRRNAAQPQHRGLRGTKTTSACILKEAFYT
jgi:hypothetical protein